MFFSRFNDINLFLSIVSECSVPPGVGPQGGLGRRRPPWSSSARSQSVVTRMAIKILKLKIYSRFNGTDLSRSMLANFVMPQRRDRGAMAATGRRRPPWSGCIFLPSFCLANRMSEVCQPKNQQKPNHWPTRYLHEYLAEWDVWSTQPLRIHRTKMHVPYGYTDPPSWGRRR
jgi:hypothetical protein